MQTHLILGDGVAGMSAAQYIRVKQANAKIVIVSNDPQPFYYRAALTNYLSGRLKNEQLIAMPLEHWSQLSLDRVYGQVNRFNPAEQNVTLANGNVLSYDRMLIATGCSARRLQTRADDPKRGVSGANLPGIHVMRTFKDTQRIIADLAPGKQVVVLGGGILGIEACHGLHHRKANVTFVHHKPWLLDRVVDRRAGELIAGRMQRDGINVLLGNSIGAIQGSPTGIQAVVLESGQTIPCDMLVTCIGNEPNTQFIGGSGVELDRGYIPVNRQMKVDGCDNVWAAGDVTKFVDPALPFPNPSGLWQPAKKQGQLAGRGMTRSSAMADYAYAPGAIYNATTAWDLDLSTIGHHPDQDQKGDKFQSVIYDHVSAQGPVYKKAVLEQTDDGLRVVGMMLLGDRREGHALKHLMNLKGAAGDVSAIKDRIFDTTFDLASWVAFRQKQPDAQKYQQTGVTSLSPIPISLINDQMASKQKDLAIATPLKTSMAIATIDASIRLLIDGESEPRLFNQRGVRIGARDDFDIVVTQRSQSPETLLLSREGFRWVASSDSRRTSLASVNGAPLARPVTLANGDTLEFLDFKATVVLEDLEALAAEEIKSVQVQAALIVNGKPFPIRHQYTLIGTSSDNHVILEDPKVSFQHAQLHRHGDPAEYILMDVSSSGGTFVEGKQIFGSTKLLPGQQVQMGDSTVELKIFEKPKTLKTKSHPVKTRVESKRPVAQDAPPVANTPVEFAPANAKQPVTPPRPVVEVIAQAGSAAEDMEHGKTELVSTSQGMIVLTVEFGLNEGKVYEAALPVTIGRSSAASVTIRDTLLSREHCKIEETPDGFSVTDCNSSNGVRVRGEKLIAGTPFPVKTGDEIELGRSLVRFTTLQEHVAADPDSDQVVDADLVDAELVQPKAVQPDPPVEVAIGSPGARVGIAAAEIVPTNTVDTGLSASSPFQIDLMTSGDPLTADLRKTVAGELDACIGCHECMQACPLEEARSTENPITIGLLNAYAERTESKAHSGQAGVAQVALDFIDHCTQCHACVPVCPVDIHRSRIVLWNKLKKAPDPDKVIRVQQGSDFFDSTVTARKLASDFEQHPLLGCLGETEKIRLFAEAKYRNLADRELLFQEGAYLDSVWFVIEGTLETGMATQHSTFQSLVRLNNGQCVGEVSVLADQPSDVGAKAVGSTTVMGLSKYSLKSIMEGKSLGAKEFRQRMEHMYASRSVEAFFSKQSVFADISDDLVQQIVQEFSAERYLPGKLILSSKESLSRIGIVKRGFVKEVRYRDGREVVANYLQVGDAFGAIETEKQGDENAFNRRGELLRYEAGTTAEVLTADTVRLSKKYPVLASLIQSNWKTDHSSGGHIEDSGCPDGHDGILDMAGATDVLHATQLLVINTETCVDCDNCVSACQRRHGHARLDRRGSGRQIGQFQIPASCFHCEDPVCLLCSVDGIVREPTGEIRITDTCIGCRGCAERCPYDNIQMVPKHDDRSLLEKWLPKPLGDLLGFKEPDVKQMDDAEIVATKCDLCHGYNGLPACVRSCPTGAAQRVDPLEHFLNK